MPPCDPNAPAGAPPAVLAPNIVTATADGGRIVENIIYFARLLRAAGLPVGPEKTVRATEAVLAAGLESPHTLYWTLHAVFVTRRQEREIFNQAFVMFWKDPGFLQQMLSLMLPQTRPEKAADDKSMSRRLAEAAFRSADRPAPKAEERIEIDAVATYAEDEVLRAKDFEEMSADEQRRAKVLIARMRLPFEQVPTRRFEPAQHGSRIDLRRMLRESAGRGGELGPPRWRRQRWRRPPIVVLADISGSMDTYARVLIHFLHAITNDRDRVATFLFGTRLTNVTRALRNRDPDAAIAKVAADVVDWAGGTRIGACIEEFNRKWARRVLGQNALVLLFTDGLDREGGEGIDTAARRLRANCRRLVWLNPLLRYDRYAPLAAGARALSRHVSQMRPCHNLASLTELVAALEAD